MEGWGRGAQEKLPQILKGRRRGQVVAAQLKQLQPPLRFDLRGSGC